MPKQNPKYPVTCPECSYQWRSRSTTKPVCPKCFPKRANGQNGKRLDVICVKCRHRYETRRAVEDAFCPKCQGPAVLAHKWVMEVQDIPQEPEPLPPSSRRDSHQRYNRSAVEDFLHGLGCHGADNKGRCMAQRTDAEYAASLRKLIEVNRSRHDSVGEMETQMAQAVLRRLGV